MRVTVSKQPRGRGRLVAVDEPQALEQDWLTVPDVADRLRVDVGKVRRMLQDGQLLAVRRGEHNVLSVPSVLLGPDGPLPELAGTVTVLRDAGLDDPAAVDWLLSPDRSLVGGSPIGALRAGHKTEVRRRAQALAI